MADLADIDGILEIVYSLTLGLEYDQPTSLERDLDVLADEIVSTGLCGTGFKPTTSGGYLSEILTKLGSEELDGAIEACNEIADILGRVEYGNLHTEDANDLEKWVEVLVSELEGYFDALKQD